MIKKIISALTILIVLNGCSVPRIPLSAKEQSFVDLLSREYYADISISHDYKAVSQNTDTGQFRIQIKNSKQRALCDYDSTTLRETATYITAHLLTIMSHKENYSSCVIEFTKSEFPDERTEYTLCNKSFIISMKEIKPASLPY